MWEFDYRVEVAGEPTRRWRRLLREHRDEPLWGDQEGAHGRVERIQHIDNHRALEVGHLREGLGPFEVRRPKGSEGYPEVTVRESPEELTLRAEEVRSVKAYVNVDHIARERLVRPLPPPLVDYDGHAFCQALYKGVEGKDSLMQNSYTSSERERMECERKNNYHKNETVFGKKFQCEGEGGRIGMIDGTRRC